MSNIKDIFEWQKELDKVDKRHFIPPSKFIKIGAKYIVVENVTLYGVEIGDILTLVDDDKSSCPSFKGKVNDIVSDGISYQYWAALRPYYGDSDE